VSIGTVVTLQDIETNQKETYTILGAWDSDPERHIISYQTAIGQALLGRTSGETVSLNTERGAKEFRIVSIEAAPMDATTRVAGRVSEAGMETASAK
jgi:transcription elongation GreA/GreB family factor